MTGAGEIISFTTKDLRIPAYNLNCHNGLLDRYQMNHGNLYTQGLLRIMLEKLVLLLLMMHY